MKYGHVGRPTNEEVAARKRKTLIPIVSAVVVIAVILLIVLSNTSMNGTMGNSVVGTSSCECEEGMTLEGKNCIKEEEIGTVEANAYIVGDINGDNTIDMSDYNELKKIIDNGSKVEENIIYVYDINDDKKVDEADLEELSQLISSSATNGSKASLNYACPDEMEISDTDENGNVSTMVIRYNLVDKKCEGTVLSKIKTEAVCTESDEIVIDEEKDVVDEAEEQEMEEIPGNEIEVDEDLTAYRESNNLNYGSSIKYYSPNCKYGKYKSIKNIVRKEGICYKKGMSASIGTTWSACEKGIYDTKMKKCKITPTTKKTTKNNSTIRPKKTYYCNVNRTLMRGMKGRYYCKYDEPAGTRKVQIGAAYDISCLKRNGVPFTDQTGKIKIDLSRVPFFEYHKVMQKAESCYKPTYVTKYICPTKAHLRKTSKGRRCIRYDYARVKESCPVGYKYVKNWLSSGKCVKS